MARLSKFSSICHTCGAGVASSDFTRKVYFENHIKSHEAGKAYHNRFNKDQDIFANIQSGEQKILQNYEICKESR